MTKKLTPAAYVIKVLGGYRATARILCRDVSSVHRWVYPRNGGKGGTIPAKMMRKIYDYAKAKRLPITLLDLVYGK